MTAAQNAMQRAIHTADKPEMLREGTWRGWRFMLHRSPYVPGMIAAWAAREGREVSASVATLDEARAWLVEMDRAYRHSGQVERTDRTKYPVTDLFCESPNNDVGKDKT